MRIVIKTGVKKTVPGKYLDGSPWERKATLIAGAGFIAAVIIRVRTLFMVLTPFLAALILAYILAPAIRFWRGAASPALELP